jgi:hypothetical protein
MTGPGARGDSDSRAVRRRATHRLILQRSRERRRQGRRIALVEFDEATVDMLVRGGWLNDGATDTPTIANAISRLLKSLAETHLISAPRSALKSGS